MVRSQLSTVSCGVAEAQSGVCCSLGVSNHVAVTYQIDSLKWDKSVVKLVSYHFRLAGARSSLQRSMPSFIYQKCTFDKFCRAKYHEILYNAISMNKRKTERNSSKTSKVCYIFKLKFCAQK